MPDQYSYPRTEAPDIINGTSPSVNEIIAASPSYIVRKGTSIILIILTLIVAGMWFINYPDTLQGTVTLTTTPLPIRLKSSGGGRLLQLFVKEGATIVKDQPVAELENNTGYHIVQLLAQVAGNTLEALEQVDITRLNSIAHTEMQSLGDAQPIYNSLLDAISTYTLVNSHHIYNNRSASLRSQIGRYQSISAISDKEKAMVREELKQADERFLANEQLYKDKVISRQEYFDEAARLRQKKLVLEQQEQTTLQNNISIAEHNKQMMEIRYEASEKETNLSIRIREQVRNLQNFVQGWKLKYLLVAPYDGTVHFPRPLQLNEPVNAGDELCTVVPLSFKYVAYAILPAGGAGKIKPGQAVHLLLDKFPHNEYGYLVGRVSGIAPLPQQNKEGATYRVAIALPDTLTTTYKRPLVFNAEMTGTARIITKKRNLLQRLVAGMAAFDQ